MLPVFFPIVCGLLYLECPFLMFEKSLFHPEFLYIFVVLVHDKDSPTCLKELLGPFVSGAAWPSSGIQQLGRGFVAAPQRDDYLFLLPKITIALSDSFLRLVKSNTLSDFEHYF